MCIIHVEAYTIRITAESAIFGRGKCRRRYPADPWWKSNVEGPPRLPVLQNRDDLSDVLRFDVAADRVVNLQMLMLLVQLPSNDVGINHLNNEILVTVRQNLD